MKNTSFLQEQLNYTFQNIDLLNQALRHRSYSNEQSDPLPHNERLEFLGDAILEMVVSEFLYQIFPKSDEGLLSQLRSRLVNTLHLASVARDLSIGDFLFLSKGETLGRGYEKDSILAGAMEAVVAAIYLDGGFTAAQLFIRQQFQEKLISLPETLRDQDHKTLLQEMAQQALGSVPHYKIIEESGPDHDKRFIVQVSFGEKYQIGYGKSKKAAEQDAAKKTLALLKMDLI